VVPQPGEGDGAEDGEGQPDWTAPTQGGLTPAETTAGAAAPKRGRRKATADIAAAQAAAMTTAEPTPAAATAPLQQTTNPALPPGVQPGGFAIPPGASAPQQAQPVPPPDAAMPKADPPPPANAGGEMRLEDFKAECVAIYQEAQSRGLTAAYPFNVVKSETWPDGSPKPFRFLNPDSTPPEFRRRVLDECMAIMMRG
jgi:hypothetical protein